MRILSGLCTAGIYSLVANSFRHHRIGFVECTTECTRLTLWLAPIQATDADCCRLIDSKELGGLQAAMQ